MFRQYRDIKSRHEDTILMFRMGDFYEMFFDDAIEAARLLEITLTTRGRGTGSEAPMCGVPYHAVDGYIARLTRAGKKVAVCDQVEDASQARGLVKRDVTRVVTPGTVVDSRMLEAGEPNGLGAIRAAADGMAVAWVDLSTGDFRHALFPPPRPQERALDLLARFNCRELLIPDDETIRLDPGPGILVNRREAWRFDGGRGHDALTRHLGTTHLEGFGIEPGSPAAGAAGAVLDYLQDTQKARLSHIDRLRRFDEESHLVLDAATVSNLEVVRTQREGKRRGSLLGTVDRTVTGMGARLLKERLMHPLTDAQAIRRRLAMVGDLLEQGLVRERIRKRLGEIADIERLLARLTLGQTSPREVRQLGASLEILPELKGEAAHLRAEPLVNLLQEMDPVAEVAGRVRGALMDEPPATLRDGGCIRDGHDAALDELRALDRDGKSFLTGLEARERERTGIASLKVRFNKVFGYFIEVRKTSADRIPEDYVRKQTLAGAERFFTPELKGMEEKLLTARDKMQRREVELFEEMRLEILESSPRLRSAAADVAALDVAACLADVAAREAWCAPSIQEPGEIRVEAGRHPVVEAAVGRDRFVPNDTHLCDEQQIQIITGPNMGGKSTLLRQVGLVVLLAQAGSYVPAASARVGITDRIFCRVGASDSLATGQSTFMVEMTETANILHHATHRSLALLDEVGRGTATFDGLSIAWAVVEHLHQRPEVAARTLFATHYHELTELAAVLPRVINLRMTAREHAGRIVFLHRVEEGAADQSYGIQVAALAGLPPEVVQRAREILEQLERHSLDARGRPSAGMPGGSETDTAQLGLFAPAPAAGGGVTGSERQLLREIRDLEPENMTPLDALRILHRLHQDAGTSEEAQDETDAMIDSRS